MRLQGNLMGVIGAIAVVAATTVAAGFDRTPDAGMMDVFWAEPYEDVSVLKLERGRTLGELLEFGQLSGSEQQGVLLAFAEHASARRVRDGTEVTLRRARADGRLRRVEIGVSPDETVQMSRNGSDWTSRLIETPVWVDTVFAAGAIEDVLWNAVAGNQALKTMPTADRARLIHNLDQVFQWQVDFSRQIQKGDFYRFAVQREVRPDGSMRSSTLLAAELVNSGAALQAIYFDPDGDGLGSYFDAEGRSVRRAFLTKPLEFRRISSRFSSGRFHPILKRWRAHRGIDYAANTGTPIFATGDGVIVKRGRNGGLGNAVEIQHPNGFVTRYGHMSRFASGQSTGTRVVQGETIGYVGMTGLATGPHLHYEMLRSGRHMDPLSVDLPAGDPVPTEAWDLWELTLGGHLALIDHLPTTAPSTVSSLSAEDAEILNERARSSDRP